MTCKYFKYILFSLVTIFIYINNVNAAYCQYEIEAADKTYFYVRYNISNETVSGIQCCHTTSKQGSDYTCENKCSIAGQQFDGGYSFYPISNADDTLTKHANLILKNGECNDIVIWYEKDSQKSINASFEDENIKNQAAQDLGRTYKTIHGMAGSGTDATINSTKKYRRQIDNGDWIEAYQKGDKKIVEVVGGQKYEVSSSNDLTIEANGGKYIIPSMDLGNLFSDDKDFYVVKDLKNGKIYYTTSKSLDVFLVRRSDIESNGKVEDLTKICKDKNVKTTFKILGYALIVAKILIPLIIIISGSISFSQSLISADDEALKKNVKTLIIKIIAGIVVFLLPSIINIILNIVDSTNDNSNSEYESCSKCILEPKKC